MILADTSVWIRHFSTPNHPLSTELIKNNISIHSIVIGELACGSLRHRGATLTDLNDLPQVIGVQHADVLHFIEHQKLYSRGIGYSDFHLLAATKLGQAKSLWTVDKRLNQLATELGVAYQC